MGAGRPNLCRVSLKFSWSINNDYLIITNMQYDVEKKVIKKIKSSNKNVKIIPFSILNKRSLFWSK